MKDDDEAIEPLRRHPQEPTPDGASAGDGDDAEEPEEDGDEPDYEPVEVPDITVIESNIQASRFIVGLLRDIRDAVFDIATDIEEIKNRQ
jgi:hypothetical protein